MYKGDYKPKNVNGKAITYSPNDIVSYQGNMYSCVFTTQKSPIQTPKNWNFVGADTSYISEKPPLNPKQGQIWISTNGVQYVWFKDTDGFQWVQT